MTGETISWLESVEREARRLLIVRTTPWRRLQVTVARTARRVHPSTPIPVLLDRTPRLRGTRDYQEAA